MFGTVCPQCIKPLNGTAHRLVSDSCGHQKCRLCLLLDEENCRQCKEKESVKKTPPSIVESVIKFETNHTGVITCNGTPRRDAPISNQINNNTNGTSENNINGFERINHTFPISTRTSTSKEKICSKGKGTHSKKSYQTVPNHITVNSKDHVLYRCNICLKQFTTKSHVKYHVYCTGKKKPFQCGVCLKEFVTKSHLDVHMVKHTGDKTFSCSVCGRAFSEKCKLKRHSLLHTNIKPYMCSECGKSFRSKDSLKIHTLIHRGERPYSCTMCSATFNNSSNLNKHAVTHSKEKVHMCDQCGKRFKFKWTLTVHRRSHLRIRPFECGTCSKAFVNNKDLQRHQLIHLETKAYNCSICMTSFRRKDNLYRHVKNTHPGKKADPVLKTVKQLIMKPPVSKPIDNPNAINVITVSPACKSKTESPKTSDNRTGTVINGPLKLAFKTNAFKSSYNIQRDYDGDLLPKVSKPYDLAESVNICQKILSPHSPPRTQTCSSSIIRKVSEASSTEICQKILSPYPTRPLHYETSFEHKKHAIIKNIKFKLPANYTNLKSNETLSDVVPLKPVSAANINLEAELGNRSDNTYAELKTISNATTSVIVNSNLSNMHWRRRTSQNLSLSLNNKLEN